MTAKRIAVAAAAGTAAVATVAGLATTSATAAPDSPSQRVVFQLDGSSAHMSFFGKDADNPQPGDRLTEHATLKQHGKVVGRFLNACLLVIGGPKANDDVCDGVLEVGGSQIVLGGSGNPRVVPVVGGSGKYAFAVGYVKETSTSTGARFTVVYRTVRR